MAYVEEYYTNDDNLIILNDSSNELFIIYNPGDNKSTILGYTTWYYTYKDLLNACYEIVNDDKQDMLDFIYFEIKNGYLPIEDKDESMVSDLYEWLEENHISKDFFEEEMNYRKEEE